jgi:hypothetical protein
VFAYIDPGSGLLIWQAITAACLGVLFYLKKVRQFFGKIFQKILPPAKTPQVDTEKQP